MKKRLMVPFVEVSLFISIVFIIIYYVIYNRITLTHKRDYINNAELNNIINLKTTLHPRMKQPSSLAFQVIKGARMMNPA